MDWESVKNKLVQFLKEEVEQRGAKGLVLGLSGGLDSAVVAVLSKIALGDNLLCVMLPTNSSNEKNIQDAIALCKKFDLNYKSINISTIVDSYFANASKDKLRVGNFCARVRMSVLYDISAQKNALVVGTSNKSELLLGYGTIYGDIACAINPIGQIYKSDLFEFAKFLGITNEIIEKKPSADLWVGQSDEEDLGFSYKQLDEVLKLLIDENKSKIELLKDGFGERIIDTVLHRVNVNKFKAKLPKIAKITG